MLPRCSLPTLLLLLLSLHSPSAKGRSHYATLGVPRDANLRQIKKAYRTLALELHPDKIEESLSETKRETLLRRFIEVASAYECLSDPDRRRRYDLLGEDSGPSGEGGGGGTVARDYTLDAFDIYVRVDSGSFELHWTPPNAKRMDDTIVTLTLTLEELYAGCERSVVVNVQRLCPHCGGSGSVAQEHLVACPACGGAGHRLHVPVGADAPDARDPHATLQVVNSTCTRCMGTGLVCDDDSHRCPVCGGERTVVLEHRESISVPAGTQAADFRVVRQGLGNQKVGFEDGSLVFRLEAAPHGRFRLEGFDLHLDAHISLVEALVGFEKRVRHLDGSIVVVSNDDVAWSGFEVRVPERGFPRPAPAEASASAHNDAGGTEDASAFGDLVVHFTVQFPRQLSKEQLEVLALVMDEEDISILEDVVKLNAAMLDEEQLGKASGADALPDEHGGFTSCTPLCTDEAGGVTVCPFEEKDSLFLHKACER